jgi:hypothetical protein
LGLTVRALRIYRFRATTQVNATPFKSSLRLGLKLSQIALNAALQFAWALLGVFQTEG